MKQTQDSNRQYYRPEVQVFLMQGIHSLLTSFSLDANVEDFDSTEQDDF